VTGIRIELHKFFCTTKRQRKNIIRVVQKSHLFLLQSPPLGTAIFAKVGKNVYIFTRERERENCPYCHEGNREP
jgi:flavorubredoxin